MSARKTPRSDRRNGERRAFPHYMQFMNALTGELLGDLADISPGGFRLESSKPIPLNTEFAFRVDMLPEISTKPWIAMTARSRWSLPHPVDGRLHEVGFEIMKMDPSDRNAFELIFDRFGSTSSGKDSGIDYLWAS